MSEIEEALQALAERGIWIREHGPDGELLRVELRRAAKARGIRVRTWIGADGSLRAHTPDGLPAEEPWRGAALHVHESGAMDHLIVHGLDRIWRGDAQS